MLFLVPPDPPDLTKCLVESSCSRSDLMTSEEQLLEFLRESNRKGARYCPKTHPIPNLSRLAAYCGCSCSTLLRIANGETRKASLRTLSILNVIACICPAPYGGDLERECRARIADADRWLRGQCPEDYDILVTLRRGICQRIEEHKSSQSMRSS